MLPPPEEKILEVFTQVGITLSVAESCTGGALSARLTSISGSSKYFMGGIIAYSNEMKSNWLGVSPLLLEEKGAVSKEVVEAMVLGILQKSHSDYAIATTGIAGPSGGTEEKPIGTVWFGIGKKNGEILSWKIMSKGMRHEIINTTIENILEKLLSMFNP